MYAAGRQRRVDSAAAAAVPRRRFKLEAAIVVYLPPLTPAPVAVGAPDVGDRVCVSIGVAAGPGAIGRCCFCCDMPRMRCARQVDRPRSVRHALLASLALPRRNAASSIASTRTHAPRPSIVLIFPLGRTREPPCGARRRGPHAGPLRGRADRGCRPTTAPVLNRIFGEAFCQSHSSGAPSLTGREAAVWSE